MSPTIVYIYPANDGPNHTELAMRFVETYNVNPPGMEHKTVVVLNGARVCTEFRCLFSSLQNLQFLEHDDSGWDIGGYQTASMRYPAELMVFFGGSTYLRRPGWLRRMVEAFERRGPALFGAMGNRGDIRVNVMPHIRTTGFWLPSDLMNRYPIRITQHSQRYEFEHGKSGLSEWIRKQGLKRYVVAWTGEYEWAQWDSFPNGFHRGDQSALLVGDRLTEPPFYSHP